MMTVLGAPVSGFGADVGFAISLTNVSDMSKKPATIESLPGQKGISGRDKELGPVNRSVLRSRVRAGDRGDASDARAIGDCVTRPRFTMSATETRASPRARTKTGIASSDYFLISSTIIILHGTQNFSTTSAWPQRKCYWIRAVECPRI
jgi:hypothetical protein